MPFGAQFKVVVLVIVEPQPVIDLEILELVVGIISREFLAIYSNYTKWPSVFCTL